MVCPSIVVAELNLIKDTLLKKVGYIDDVCSRVLKNIFNCILPLKGGAGELEQPHPKGPELGWAAV